MTNTTATDVAHRARRSMMAVTTLSVAMLVLAGAVMFSTLRTPPTWSPLGPNPVQTVEEPRDGTDTPVVSLANPVVHVRARKCVEGAGFTISGVVSWQSVEPRGTIVQTGTGNREAADGCTTIEYRNDIPDEVQDLMRRQLDDGLEPMWHISGVKTPIDDNRTGTPATWVTEPFRIVP